MDIVSEPNDGDRDALRETLFRELRTVDPAVTYFAATLLGGEEGWRLSFQSRFAGWSDGSGPDKGVELREAAPVCADRMTRVWDEFGEGWIAMTKPESTDGFVGSTVWGPGWPLGWCVCAGRRVLGRAGLECGAGVVGGAWGAAALRRALSGGSDELGHVADVSQGGGEGVCPWPVERQAQSVAAAVVDEAAWHSEEPVADGGRDGELGAWGGRGRGGRSSARGCARARSRRARRRWRGTVLRGSG